MDNKNLIDAPPASSRRGSGENAARRLVARGWPEGDEATEKPPNTLDATEPSPPLWLASAGGDVATSAPAAPAVEVASLPVVANNGWALAGGVVVFGALAGPTRKKDDSSTDSSAPDHTAPTATIRHPSDSKLALEWLNDRSVDAGMGPLKDTPIAGINVLIDGVPVTLTSRDIQNAGQQTLLRTATSDIEDYRSLANAFNEVLGALGYGGDIPGKSLISVRVGPTFDTISTYTGTPIKGIGYQLHFVNEGPQTLALPPDNIWHFDGFYLGGPTYQRLYALPSAFTGPVPFTINFNEPVSGLTLDDFSVSGGSKLALTGAGASYTLTVMPNANAQGTLGVHLLAGAVHDAAGNGNATAVEESVLFDTRNASYTPGQPSIDLGVYGRLIAPVQSDGGGWYYYWDRSSDGSSADKGGLNGGYDAVSHDELDALFVLDAAGQIGGGISTSESVRYASLNGVKLALPTANGGAPLPAGIGHPQPGTEIDNRPAGEPNVTYNDLLALWDGQNGSTTATGQSGAPAGWAGGLYWSATASANGHLGVDLLTGTEFDDIDARTAHVAVWVV